MAVHVTNGPSSFQDSWRDLRAIRNDQQEEFINSLNVSQYLWEDKAQEFIENFKTWLKGSRLNDFSALDKYPHASITCGTAQSFDHWYLKHHRRFIRVNEGEFMYHQASTKRTGMVIHRWDGPLLEGRDSCILSMPFSGTGFVHKCYDRWLNEANLDDIPMMLDFCHAPTSRHLVLHDRECIKEINFSVSKAFWGGEWLRVGVRFSREEYDDGIDILNDNEIQMINRLGVGVANELIQKYEFDYPWLTYENAYNEVCKRLNLVPTDNIMFAMGGEEYKDFERAGKNRICLSEEIYRCLGSR